jgi:WD40 repeat protein
MTFRIMRAVRPLARSLALQLSLGLLGTSAVMADDIPNRVADGVLPLKRGHHIGGVQFSPDGVHVAGLGQDVNTHESIIDVWDCKKLKHLRTLRLPSPLIECAFTPDGKHLIVGCMDKQLRVYSTETWGMERCFPNDPADVFVGYLAVFPDGKRLLSASAAYRDPRVWDLASGKPTAVTAPREQVEAVAIAKDGKFFAIAFSAPVTELYNSKTLQSIGRLELPKGNVFCAIALSPDGRTAATYSIKSKGAFVFLWDIRQQKKLRQCERLGDQAVYNIAFSPDGKLLMLSMGSSRRFPGEVDIWEVSTGKLLYAFCPNQHGAPYLAMSPDGSMFVTCSADGTLELWDFAKIRKEIGR